MKIVFVLSESNEIITSINKIDSNPFKVGDRISLSIRNLRQAEKQFFSNKEIEIAKEDTIKLQNIFDLKTITLIKVNNYMEFNTLMEPNIVIEYGCLLISE